MYYTEKQVNGLEALYSIKRTLVHYIHQFLLRRSLPISSQRVRDVVRMLLKCTSLIPDPNIRVGNETSEPPKSQT